MQEDQDVLIIGGGLLEIPFYKRTMSFPFEDKNIIQSMVSSFLPNTLPGCQMESLLFSNEEIEVIPTIGLVDYKKVIHFIKTINNLGINPPDFHLGKYKIPENIIHKVQQHFTSDNEDIKSLNYKTNFANSINL